MNLGDDLEPVTVRSIRCDDPEAMQIMRSEAARTLVRVWRSGVGGHTPEGMAMHEAARLEFHLTEAVEGPIVSQDAHWNEVAEEVFAKSGEVYRDVVRSLYEVTQRELARQGITEVMLYRGMRWDDPAFPMPEWARVPDGTVIESLAMRPLQSWTSDPDIATMYAFPADDSSMVVGSAVPAVRLLTTPWMGVGAASLSEFVVLSADGLVTTVRGPR
jgi:hypothetical protein